MKKWEEYFEELLNNDEIDIIDKITLHVAEPECLIPSRSEVSIAIKRLKNNKSPGSDGIHSELLKKGGLKLELELTELLQMIWKEERLPDEWT